MAKDKKRIVTVEVTEFSSRGNGRGTFDLPDGKKAEVEVPFTIPGDQAQALLLRKRGGLYKSLLEEITRPSPERIPPRCIHFGVCGGCRWQQISYEKQLHLKQIQVEHLFAPFLTHRVLMNSILPCLPPWNYRNKMEFTFSTSVQKEHYLGLIIDSSRGKVFNLTECHLVNGWFAECVKAVRSWWRETGLDAYYPPRNVGSLRTLTLREGQYTGDRLLMLTVSGNSDYALKKQQIESFCAFVRDAIEPSESDKHLSIFIRIQQAVKGVATNFFEMHLYGPDVLHEVLHVVPKPGQNPLALTFAISPTAFFQPNTRQAEQLYSLALQLAEIDSEEVIYDLYCGTGTLGICAASVAKKVIGIELVPEAVLDAKANAEANDCHNIEFFGGDVATVLEEMQQTGQPKPTLIFVDPPRVGLDPKAIQHILRLAPRKILYISCNPATQANNLPPFLEAGYKLKVLQPVDQFPQTLHVENILVLEKEFNS